MIDCSLFLSQHVIWSLRRCLGRQHYAGLVSLWDAYGSHGVFERLHDTTSFWLHRMEFHHTVVTPNIGGAYFWSTELVMADPLTVSSGHF